MQDVDTRWHTVTGGITEHAHPGVSQRCKVISLSGKDADGVRFGQTIHIAEERLETYEALFTRTLHLMVRDLGNRGIL